MVKLINKPHIIFAICVPIIFLLSILVQNDTLDVNIHDTYYVISNFHVSILLTLLLSLIAFGYWMMIKADRRLNKWLNLSHILLTLGSLLVPYTYWIISLNFNSDSTVFNDYNSNLNTLLIFVIASIILGQIIFLINIVIGLLLKKRKI